jgi:hypothetical protein
MIADAPLRYTLLDPHPVAAEARYTYFLPSDAEIAAVSIGDHVQLTFEYIPPGDKWAAERMWVTVQAVDGDRLIGVLASTPDDPKATVCNGDEVSFERRLIINVAWADPETAPPPTPCRDYWERCMVDQCVLDGVEPVEFIYREAPDMQEDGDTYPDSGWRIRGRMGDATDEEIEEREAQYVAIGAVLNQDDSWLHLVDAPEGSRFMRNFATGVYEPEQA